MGNFEPLMNFNLPELLVGDLEESEEVFRSRELTAGAPSPTLVDDGSKRRYTLQDSSLSAAPFAYSLDMTSRARSLQNVHEKQMQLITIHYDSQHNNSDSDTASSGSSGGLVPPSVGTRDASVATTDTSVTSERMEPRSKLKLVIQDKKQAGESWMDLDDTTSPDRRYNSMVNLPSPAQLLSLRQDLGESRSMSLNAAVQRPKVTGPAAPSPTILRKPPTGEQRKHIKQPTVPNRRYSLLYQNYPVLPEVNVSPLLPTPSTLQTNGMQSSPGPNIPSLDLPGAFGPRANANDDNGINNDVRTGLPSLEPPRHEPEQFSPTESCQFPEIAPLGIDVESWLESSVDNFSYHAQTKSEGGHTPLPLPPDVIDTLRVSITCFPETMLQCSSLSIETIRGHSRKLRYKATSPASLYSESPVSADSLEPSKQSKWKWNPLKKQQSYPSQTPPSPQRSGFSEGPDSRYGPSWPRRPDWTAIQNLFPTGTDYLCDALYAHLVAYNYITSLCPRSALVNQTSRPSSRSSAVSNISLSLSADLRTSVDVRSSTSDGTSIPLKAANLLGLQEDPNSPIPGPPSSRCNNALRNKRSLFALSKSASFYEVHRPTTSTAGFSRRSPLSDQNDQLLRDLRLGLAKCISRLVATLRMTNGGATTSTDGVAQLKREEDPDFMRALCEIVRLSEERYM